MFIARKIKLSYEPVHTRIITDEKWLVFVLEQILSNALKYTRTGSISIYMEGERLVIEDTGIGIYGEDLPRVFEKGFTGYNGRTDKKSTGILVFICVKRLWISYVMAFRSSQKQEKERRCICHLKEKLYAPETDSLQKCKKREGKCNLNLWQGIFPFSIMRV